VIEGAEGINSQITIKVTADGGLEKIIFQTAGGTGNLLPVAEGPEVLSSGAG
jgi:hypothetical protein